MVYLDNAATTRVDDTVISAMNEIHVNQYANASSKHQFGKQLGKVIFEARESISERLNCNPSEIYFNSGATEGINTAIKGFVESNLHRGQHIITTNVEHKAVLETHKYLENIGVEVTYLEVDNKGVIELPTYDTVDFPQLLYTLFLYKAR